MKKALLIVAAIILALLTAEGFLRYVVNYPPFGVRQKVHYRQGTGYWSNLYKPHSAYWNVEGGNVVFQKNNCGLPGTDIDLQSNKRIAVLGTSFVEAIQMPPEEMATSVFSTLLNHQENRYGVFNLGCSGHDPYDSYFRLLYFDQLYHFDTAILVLNSDNADWFKRHPHPLPFEPDAKFGRIDQSRISNEQIRLRNASSMIALMANGLRSDKNEPGAEEAAGMKKDDEMIAGNVFTDDMKQTLLAFSRKYPSFIVVSLINDSDFNNQISGFCSENSIHFNSKPLVVPRYMLHGGGHLNQEGNRLLGLLLFDAYKDLIDN